MKTAANLCGRTAALLAMLVAAHSLAADNPVTPAMTGPWEGNARIIVTWCAQTNLPVAIEIHADGTVTGRVGDATLSDARLRTNRGWLGRQLNLATDYVIRGKLDGPIVAAEGIRREGVAIPLNFQAGGFKGAVHTTGRHVGGKKDMVLSAAGLALGRPQPAKPKP